MERTEVFCRSDALFDYHKVGGAASCELLISSANQKGLNHVHPPISDGELPLLMRYLDQLKDAKSIRAVEKRRWRRNLASP